MNYREKDSRENHISNEMTILVLVRHGKSEYNKKNLFTGWKDVDLAPEGEEEARKAGKKLKGFKFDIAYTSVLIRAIRTLNIIMDIMNHPPIRTIKDKALNERNYGDLIGMNKDDARKKFGAEKVHKWRRSYDIQPPGGESLKDTANRTLPHFDSTIMKDINDGKNVIVSAHHNSLRSIVMKLDNLSEEEVVNLEIPTGIPIVYEFKEGKIVSKNILD